jgi:hypothetical protein
MSKELDEKDLIVTFESLSKSRVKFTSPATCVFGTLTAMHMVPGHLEIAVILKEDGKTKLCILGPGCVLENA